MAELDILESLPDISILEDEGITLEGIQNDMINDYEVMYEELTGEELTLYPADERRILVNVVAGKLFQLAEIANDRFKQNFLKYMYGDSLKNWAANFGFTASGLSSAATVLKFTLSSVQANNIIIPQGTRATAGDNIFFATDEDVTIEAGETEISVPATCTVFGITGNGYLPGQLNIIADPISMVQSVTNTVSSYGGHDEYTDDELKEKVMTYPYTYSTAGPEGAYIDRVKEYSSAITDVKVITNDEATVMIYIMLADCVIPQNDYCTKVLEFLHESKTTPDTDKVEIHAPGKVEYAIDITYYIPEEKKDIEDSVKLAVEEAVNEFVAYTAGKIGRPINPDQLVSYCNVAGTSRITLKNLPYTAIQSTQIAICTDIKLTYGGIEDV